MQHSNQQHSSTSSDTELMEQVAEWLLKIDSAECTEQDRKDFQHWQQQNPKHAEMVQQMQATFQQFNPLRQQALSHQIVEKAVQQTREDEVFKPYKLLSIIFLVCLLGSFWYVSFTQHWFADQRNDYMSWSEQVLPDQSEIRISGQTAYNIKYNQQQRLIELLDGNILVDVAKDSTRPFMIDTRFARIRALGTRFIVQHHDRATILTMLHSSTEVTATLANGQLQRQKVHAGQQVMIDAQGIHAVRDISIEMAETAWQKHMLAIDLMPLDQLLAILQSYDDRHFKYDARALNDIEVTAMLPLDGSGLDLLQQSLAITVRQDVWGRTIISKK